MKPGDIDRLAFHIGAECQSRREAKGYSVQAFAPLALTHRPIVSRLEAGRHMPSITTLAYWCEVFGCQISDVLIAAEQRLAKEIQSDLQSVG